MRLLEIFAIYPAPAYTYGQSGRPDAGITFEVTDSLHNPAGVCYGGADSYVGGGKGLRDDDR